MGALPNLFEPVIAEALDQEGATAESVAAAISASDLFLRAIRIGMETNADPESLAKIVRYALSKAFGAGTANLMFDE